MSTFYKNFYKKKDFLNSIAKELNKAYGFSLAEFALKNYFFKVFQQLSVVQFRIKINLSFYNKRTYLNSFVKKFK
ncbi:hypothetical protein [Borreliella bavariensis]|uniref:hypothetical protein n=1 Tax=Borreliella bavariensis TaxID=664662 RepID=UPI00165E7CBB|nr:hypothetical protein [Borreliella bavariensis]